MLLRLGDTDIHLQSDSEPLRAAWKTIFSNAPQHNSAKPATVQLTLDLRLVASLSAPPFANLIYRDPQDIVDVYRDTEDGFNLHFRRGALVHLTPDRSDAARGLVTATILDSGQLEDVTFTALAPLLRRRQRYLSHAAAVSGARGAVLLVGPTHSGKTTTGLALVLAGWKHLASDVVLLSRGPDVLAHPTAGLLGARPTSFKLLPALRQLLPDPGDPKPILHARRLFLAPERWGKPSAVAAICFPQLAKSETSSLRPLPTSVALARLMEESVDRWDTATLEQHMAFLERLCRQARPYRLALAPDVERLPDLLESIT